MLKPGLVRFLLSSIVIFYHLSGHVYIGAMAVYCFFILSGYWVTFMYDQKYVKYESRLSTFYISRIFRLFPVYLLMGLLTIIVTIIYQPNLFGIMPTDLPFWLSNVFLLGYNQLIFKPVVPAWSLDIELQFYILLPLLFVLSNTRNTRLFLLVNFCILSVIISVFFPQTFAGRSVLPYLSYFLVGIFIYKSKLEFTRKTEIFFDCLLIFCLMSHYILGITTFYKAVKSYPNYESYFNQLISLLAIPLLSNCVNNKSDKLDRILGEMSYVLYLTHWLVLIPFNHYIVGISKFQRVPLTVGYLVVTYSMAYLIFKYYDKPIDKLRRNWLERRLMKSDANKLQSAN